MEMEQTLSLGNKIGKNIYDKIDRLNKELFESKLIKNLSNIEKKRISVIINEIRYDANRIKNYR